MPTAKRPPTPTSTPRLSEIARHVIVPKGAVSTAWPSVRDKCLELGVEFDDWQHGTGAIILSKRKSGLYAAGIGGVVISIPRQVGKTYLLGAIIFALCLLNPGMTVIWTSHRLRTSKETFQSLQGFARRKAIKPYISKIVLGSGDEEVQFRNRSRILFGARERGFGLGFSEVDVIVFDEAQRLTDKALDDMVPTTNQSRQAAGPLLLFTGTPPRPTDDGEVFSRKRADALAGEDADTAYIEFSADPDVNLDKWTGRRPEDWLHVKAANPSHPKRTPREAILRMRKQLTLDSFIREGLGRWDSGERPLIMPNWPTCSTTNEPTVPSALGVAVDPDRIWVSVGAFGEEDGRRHLAPVRVESGVLRRRLDVDRALIVREVKRIQDAHDCAVVIDKKGPAASLGADLEAVGVRITWFGLDDYVTACSDLADAVAAKQVEHGEYPELDAAVAAASKRKVGERWAWARHGGDVSMLEAVTLAFGAPVVTSTYEDRGLVTL